MCDNINITEALAPAKATELMGAGTVQPLNPWLSVWLKPSATIQQIIDTSPKRSFYVLAWINGVTYCLSKAMDRNGGDRMSLLAILAVAVLLALPGGLLSFYISGFLLRITGKWIGGTGTGQNIRASVAWSQAPSLVLLPAWALAILYFGKELFCSTTPPINGHVINTMLLTGFGTFQFAVGIWSCIVWLKMLAQVQRFSVWEALLNAFLTVLLIAIPIIVIVLVWGVVL